MSLLTKSKGHESKPWEHPKSHKHFWNSLELIQIFVYFLTLCLALEVPGWNTLYLNILEQTQTFLSFQNGRIRFLWPFQQSNFEVNIDNSKFCGPGNQMNRTQIGRKFRRKKLIHRKFYLLLTYIYCNWFRNDSFMKTVFF